MKGLLTAWEPSPKDPFDLTKAGHLLRRAGFGASLTVRRRLVRRGVQQALAFVAPADVPPTPDEAMLQDAIAFGALDRIRAFRVWLALHHEHRLAQRMSYFWHGHFATSNQKLEDPRAMAGQLATFDRLGLRRFDELLLAMCRDPALLRWLDNDVNTRARPNENFARELFELFALGRGHYSEADIREAARCFTGWHVRDGGFHFQARLHDDGDKVLFGERGRFDGGDVVARTVARRESAAYLAGRWLRFFVHPEPEPAEIDALADVYERSGRDVGATIRALLASRLFFSPRALRSKVKSPADFVLGTITSLGARAAATELAVVMATLGEAWLEPPSVEGWHGERAWLSPAAWLLRSNFVADLLAGRTGKLTPSVRELLGPVRTPRAAAAAAVELLLDGDVADDDRDRLTDVAADHAADPDAQAAAVLHATACLPNYHLA